MSSTAEAPSSTFTIAMALNNKGVEMCQIGDKESGRKCFLAAMVRLEHVLNRVAPHLQESSASSPSYCGMKKRSFSSLNVIRERNQHQSSTTSESLCSAASLPEDARDVARTQSSNEESNAQSPINRRIDDDSGSPEHSMTQQPQESFFIATQPLHIEWNEEESNALLDSKKLWKRASFATAMVAFNVAMTHHDSCLLGSSDGEGVTSDKYIEIARTFYAVAMKWRKLISMTSRRSNPRMNLLDFSILNNLGVLYHQAGKKEAALRCFEILHSRVSQLNDTTETILGFIRNVRLILPFRPSISAPAA